MLYAGQEREAAFENDGALRPRCLCKPGSGARQEVVTKRSEKIEAVNGNKRVAASALEGRSLSLGVNPGVVLGSMLPGADSCR